MSEESPTPAATPGIPLESLEVPVRFDLGESNTTIGVLQSLQAGYVFDLGRPLDHAVAISIGGAEVARGELVNVGGRLGVRVVEVLDHAIDNA